MHLADTFIQSDLRFSDLSKAIQARICFSLCTCSVPVHYIPVHTIVNLYIVIPYLLVLFNSSLSVFFFCPCHSVALR